MKKGFILWAQNSNDTDTVNIITSRRTNIVENVIVCRLAG